MRIDANALTSNIAKMLSVHGNKAFSAAAGAGAGKARAADSAAFSPKSQSLGQIGALLGRLSAAVRNIGATPDGIGAAHADIKGIEASIERALSRNGGSSFETSWVSGAVSRFKISDLDLRPGETLDVEVEVTQSAQQGGLYLSFGRGEYLDGLPRTMTFRVSGPDGVADLTFTSGTTMSDIAAAINWRSSQTGTRATPVVSGGSVGVMLRSDEFGSGAFASVQIVDDFGIGSGDNIGIYRLVGDDANVVDPGAHVTFDSDEAMSGVRDAGQDVRGLINGLPAGGYGTRLYAASPMFAVSLDLATGGLEANQQANAQHLGSFLAMRFTGVQRDQEGVGGAGSQSGSIWER